MEDAELVGLFWERSERAIEELGGKYGALCSSVARGILGSREDTEECVNDAYFRVWRSIPPSRPENLRAYVCKATRCAALDRYKYDHRKKRSSGGCCAALSELDDVAAELDARDAPLDALALREAMEHFLASLAERERLVFLRRYWFFDSESAIAEAMGLNKNTVKTILRRTRARLLETLTREELMDDRI